jgi:hypothetical protein
VLKRDLVAPNNLAMYEGVWPFRDAFRPVKFRFGSLERSLAQLPTVENVERAEARSRVSIFSRLLLPDSELRSPAENLIIVSRSNAQIPEENAGQTRTHDGPHAQQQDR